MKISLTRLLTPESASIAHLGTLADALSQSLNLVAQMLGSDRVAAEDIQAELETLDSQATTAHMALLTSLRSDFITPLPRQDLYLLSTWVNRAVENLCNVGAMIHTTQQYRLHPEAIDLLENLGRHADVVKFAVTQLRDFDDLEETWIQMERIAHRSERLLNTWLTHDAAELMQRNYHQQREIAHAVEKTMHSMRQLVVHLGGILVRES